MREGESPMFAVLDPHREGNREMIAALRSDAVELASTRPGPGRDWPHLPVKFRALMPGRQTAVCRLIATRNDTSFEWAFVAAFHLHQLTICGDCCYICADPEDGREFFKNWDRAGGS